MKSLIDQAIAKGGCVLSIMAHLVIDTEETIDNWNAYASVYNGVLAYIAEKVNDGSVKVVTWRELYNIFNPTGGYENDYNRCMKMVLN